MASIVIDGTEHSIPPFRLREIKAAAPYIDRVLAMRRASSREGETAEETAGRLLSDDDRVMERMTEGLSDTISVIAIGVIKGRQEYPYTVAKISAVTEEIEADMSMDEITSVGRVFDEILIEAGMVKNRPSTPRAGETTTSLSATESTGSSQS